MGRPPCCDMASVTTEPWTLQEDAKLIAFFSTHGTGNWTTVPQRAGLKRCCKTCRLRYKKLLRPKPPNLKNQKFSQEEEELIVNLHARVGNRWSWIANQLPRLPGRTNNDVRNCWKTKLRRMLLQRGIDPVTHRPFAELLRTIGVLPVRPPQPPRTTARSEAQQALGQQYHHEAVAPAGGVQAGGSAAGGGHNACVTTPTPSSAAEATPTALLLGDRNQEGVPERANVRSKRQIRPSVRVSGSEWV